MEKQKTFDEIISAVKSMGAANASIIDVADVELDEKFRDMCKANACGVYGKCWMCPPDIGDIHELMDEIKSYDRVLVFQTIGILEDSFDIEGMYEAGSRHNKLSQDIRNVFAVADVKEPLHLGAGGCRVCEKCSKITGEPCRFPDKAMSSLEAYGINVSNLAAASGMKYINGTNTVTYFGAVFFRV